MADPSFATLAASKGKDVMNEPLPPGDVEIDTCRICRGEGTPTEPLFYPCRCSGSIKFVHQDCLMEWLSHSQKKYCELCKTPFRFTKLYDPKMPKKVPFTVFVQQVARHVWRDLLVWGRAVVVVTVWLAALPWCMRYVWRMLFWIGDGGWVQDIHSPVGTSTPANDSLKSLPSALAQLLSTQLNEAVTDKANQSINWTSVLAGWADRVEPATLSLARKILGKSTRLRQSEGVVNHALNMTSRQNGFYNEKSLLSELPPFKKLSPWPVINRIFLDILEGQIITLVVVVAFILVFLIREWVVQQQPIIGAARAQAAAGNNADALNQDQLEAEADPEESDDDSDHGNDPEQLPTPQEVPAAQRPQRPPMPDRPASSLANDIRRDLEERGGQTEDSGESNSSSGSWEYVRPGSSGNEHAAGSGSKQDDSDTSQEQRSPRSGRLPPMIDTTIGNNDEDEEELEAERRAQSPMSSHFASNIVGLPPERPDEPEESVNGSLPAGDVIDQEEEPEDHIDTEHGTDDDPPPEQRQRTLLDTVMGWLWGEAAPRFDLVHDEAVDVEALAEDDAAQPIGGEQDDAENAAEALNVLPPIDAQDPEVLEAARQAGLDPDPAAIDDAEDLEGIMELIGMQGPIAGLIQNALFSAVVIASTVAAAVWFPYLWGKVVLLLVSNPVSLLIRLPLQVVTVATEIAVDTTIILGGTAVYLATKVAYLILCLWTWPFPFFAFASSAVHNWSITIQRISDDAFRRLLEMFLGAASTMDSDYLYLSLQSHAALREMKSEVAEDLGFIGRMLYSFCHSFAAHGPFFALKLGISRAVEAVGNFVSATGAWWSKNLPAMIDTLRNTKLSFNVSLPPATIELDPELAEWSAGDRFIAVIAGYAFFAIGGALYLRRGAPLSSSQQVQRFENILKEILQQAGGVMKVILIISIEMLVFPLYCGLLLDMALLPLCENATLLSRFYFTVNHPWTSSFIHWFIGTCYMFHFALFVSMCRKIMRSGVLYFIRDPDDPTFHPVRDVLERNVATQLRKITFSALIYGALVIVCLGGVVWGVDRFFEIFPIRWATNEPVLEFPIDLLLYNFLTPVLLKTLKPYDILYNVYEWWFHQCAKYLRLSHFLFGDRNPDEEGHYVYRTWMSRLTRRKVQTPAPTRDQDGESTDSVASQEQDNQALVSNKVEFISDGKFVRAPASDQVRIPKGIDVFVEVNEENVRLDGENDDNDTIHGRTNDAFAKVYIPPLFRLRIGLFVFCLWSFAAATGLGLTVVPLSLGRRLFKIFIQDWSDINDVYAFSTGIYILGTFSYLMVQAKPFLMQMSFSALAIPFKSKNFWARIGASIKQAASVIYVYLAFTVFVPLLLAVCIELYLVVPLQTYFTLQYPITHRGANAAHPSLAFNISDTHQHHSGFNRSVELTQNDGSAHQMIHSIPPHILHLLQSWTLGLLYFRIILRFALFPPNSRLSRAIRAVIRDGWLRPDARLATRGFLLPIVLAFMTIVGVPALVAYLTNRYSPDALNTIQRTLVDTAPAVLAIQAKNETSVLVPNWNALMKTIASSLYSAAGYGSDNVNTTSSVQSIVEPLTDGSEIQLSVTLLYRIAYPITFLAIMSVYGWFALWQSAEAWRKRIRDEVYLVGERLHNFGESKAGSGVVTSNSHGDVRAARTAANPIPDADVPA